MRTDMSKVIVERSRYGSKNWKLVRARLRADDPENMSRRAGMRKIHKCNGNWKDLNENLAPLYRYLIAQVGRKWNDVYSDIRSNLNANSAVQLHILQHLSDFVEINVMIVDGQLYDSAGRHKIHNFSRHHSMYVDPNDGILKKAPSWQRLTRRDLNDIIQVSKTLEYRLLKNVWFEVKFISQKIGKLTIYRDILSKDIVNGWTMHKRYSNRIPVSKRQLSKKEIKHLGLWQKYNNTNKSVGSN